MKCEVCGKRKGVTALAHYRWDDREDTFAWEKPRPIVLCKFCIHKTWATGYATLHTQNGESIFIEKIIGELKVEDKHPIYNLENLF
ncbi:MAG: hypothetical protein ACTSX6_10535 [Candidatus Heimdallarchaeaceae archaeon]